MTTRSPFGISASGATVSVMIARRLAGSLVARIDEFFRDVARLPLSNPLREIRNFCTGSDRRNRDGRHSHADHRRSTAQRTFTN